MGLVSQMRTQKREQQKSALAAGEESYRKLVEFSPDAIFVHHHHQIGYVNLAGCRLLGASKPEQLLARSLLEFVHQNDQTLVQERIIAVTKGESIAARSEIYSPRRYGDRCRSARRALLRRSPSALRSPQPLGVGSSLQLVNRYL